MKVICDETNNTKADLEKRQINITLIPETDEESKVILDNQQLNVISYNHTIVFKKECEK